MSENFNSSLVNLSIPKEVTNPIVAAKIQEAVLAALGGQEKLIAGILHTIMNTKVDENGKQSTYNNDNKHTWFDYHVTAIIQGAVKDELKKQLDAGAIQIKDELIKILQSKKGSNMLATAIIDGISNQFSEKWTSKLNIIFNEKKPQSKNDW